MYTGDGGLQGLDKIAEKSRRSGVTSPSESIPERLQEGNTPRLEWSSQQCIGVSLLIFHLLCRSHRNGLERRSSCSIFH